MPIEFVFIHSTWSALMPDVASVNMAAMVAKTGDNFLQPGPSIPRRPAVLVLVRTS